jgi:uncharacterized protein (DUF488 family)
LRHDPLALSQPGGREKQRRQTDGHTETMNDMSKTVPNEGARPASGGLITFGYGGRSLEEVVGLLARHGVRFVVDVRSVPWSRFRPEFSQDRLTLALREHGIRYLFMGAELGGRPDDAACYDAEGRVDYRACERRPAFRAGISRLRAASDSGHSLAIMCSEGRPEDCHRTKLVSQALTAAGVAVHHLDERGELRSHEDVLARLRGSQMALLDDDEQLVKSRGRYRVASV